MKTQKYVYWGSTGLLSAMTLMSVGMYLFKTDMVVETLGALGFPAYLVYVLAVVKFLGVFALWLKKYPTIKEWAYAGFSFVFLLAALSHIMIGDGEFAPSIFAFVLLMISYQTGKKLRNRK